VSPVFCWVTRGACGGCGGSSTAIGEGEISLAPRVGVDD
jgi:hypothetical protein